MLLLRRPQQRQTLVGYRGHIAQQLDDANHIELAKCAASSTASKLAMSSRLFANTVRIASNIRYIEKTGQLSRSALRTPS